PRTSSSLIAVRELRGINLRAPVESLGYQVVLLGVPEGATAVTVVGVDTHGAIVAPAIGGVRLRTCATDYLYLSLELAEAQRIVDLAPRDVNRRVRRCTTGAGASAGFAVAEQNVADLVSGQRTHPAPGSIGSVGALLEDAKSGHGDGLDRSGDFHPPRADVAEGCGHVKVNKPVLCGHRLGRIGEDVNSGLVLPIGEAVHQTIAQRVSQVGDAFLRNAIAAVGAVAGRIVGGNAQQLGVTIASEGCTLRPVARVIDVY